MSDYIDREKFIKLLVNRDLREISTKTIGECLDKAEVADVVDVSKILKTADEQEKQGFIQTAMILRKLVEE